MSLEVGTSSSKSSPAGDDPDLPRTSAACGCGSSSPVPAAEPSCSSPCGHKAPQLLCQAFRHGPVLQQHLTLRHARSHAKFQHAGRFRLGLRGAVCGACCLRRHAVFELAQLVSRHSTAPGGTRLCGAHSITCPTADHSCGWEVWKH